MEELTSEMQKKNGTGSGDEGGSDKVYVTSENLGKMMKENKYFAEMIAKSAKISFRYSKNFTEKKFTEFRKSELDRIQDQLNGLQTEVKNLRSDNPNKIFSVMTQTNESIVYNPFF